MFYYTFTAHNTGPKIHNTQSDIVHPDPKLFVRKQMTKNSDLSRATYCT